MDHATKKKPHPKRTRHQGASGRVVLDADFSARRSDVMVVQGGVAVLDGTVRPLISFVLPYVELPFLVERARHRPGAGRADLDLCP